MAKMFFYKTQLSEGNEIILLQNTGTISCDGGTYTSFIIVYGKIVCVIVICNVVLMDGKCNWNIFCCKIVFKHIKKLLHVSGFKENCL